MNAQAAALLTRARSNAAVAARLASLRHTFRWMGCARRVTCARGQLTYGRYEDASQRRGTGRTKPPPRCV
eukprot:1245982-Prymnesium_polylepis.1